MDIQQAIRKYRERSFRRAEQRLENDGYAHVGDVHCPAALFFPSAYFSLRELGRSFPEFDFRSARGPFLFEGSDREALYAKHTRSPLSPESTARVFRQRMGFKDLTPQKFVVYRREVI